MPDQPTSAPLRTVWLHCAAMVMLLFVTGCSGTRGGTPPVLAVTRDVNGCAATLPLARATVTGHSVLVEIHAISAATARRLLRTGGGKPVPQSHLRGQLCVVAYRGPYRHAQVPLARTGAVP